MHLLTCQCGETIPVPLRQAGNEITCPACSSTIQVPKLGQLRQLPQAAPSADQESPRPVSMGRRLTFAGVCLLAGIGFFVGAFSLITASTIEVESTTEEHIAADIERLQKAPPAQVTELWREYMVYGLNDRHPFPYKQHADEKAAWMRRGIIGMSVAAIAVIVAVVLARTGRKKASQPTHAATG